MCVTWVRVQTKTLTQVHLFLHKNKKISKQAKDNNKKNI